MDGIGDFCTRIRNAVMAGKDKVDMPSSKMRRGLANKLRQYGYIRDFRCVDDGLQGMMRIYLKYGKDRAPAIRSLQRLSRPSCRRYVKADEIQDTRSGYGLTILSANKGILSGREARKQNTGGELLLEVW